MSYQLSSRKYWLALGLIGGLVLLGPTAANAEIDMPNDQFAQLAQFEGHMLQQADKTFNAKEYRQAGSEYDTFVRTFPNSQAVPYALFRQARCLHLDEKRHAAIKAYQQIIDFFPDFVTYAAPSLYHIGQAHKQNGDDADAFKAWLKMAEDVEYSKHPYAAGAIYQLAEEFWKQEKFDRAAQLYMQVAIDFRKTNDDVARNAMRQAIPYLIRVKSDEDKLRDFYEAVGGFGHNPSKLSDDFGSEIGYWNTVRNLVDDHGKFSDLQKDQGSRYYGYWVKELQGKFPANDEYQIDLAKFQLRYDGNREAWVKRLDEQFEKYQKPGDYDRIVRWIQVYASEKPKAMEYYNKLDFAKMSNEDIIALTKSTWDLMKDEELSKATFGKIRLGDMTDSDRTKLAHWYHGKYREANVDEYVERIYQRYDNTDEGKYRLLGYYNWLNGDERNKKGLELAADLVNSTQENYAKGAWKHKGDIHRRMNQWDEAISAYRQWDSPPESIFHVAYVYRDQKKFQPAIAQLQEVENFFNDPKKFGDNAPRAALIAAYYYRDAGEQERYIGKLRRLMNQYPKSRQSSQAHQELERLGVKIGGAVDAE